MIDLRDTSVYFSLFESECHRWIRVFGLSDWKVYITNNEKGFDTLASVELDSEQQSALINLSAKHCLFLQEDMAEVVKGSAFHEVFHIFLSSLIYVAQQPSYNAALLEKEEHAIMLTLYPVLSGCLNVRAFPRVSVGEEEVRNEINKALLGK